MIIMTSFFDTLLTLASECEQLEGDIGILRPVTYEENIPKENLLETLHGIRAIYHSRFDALFKAYEVAVRDCAFCHYEVEEAISNWWSVIDNLECAEEGVRLNLLTTDGLDNILLGIEAMTHVRAAQFQHTLAQFKPR